MAKPKKVVVITKDMALRAKGPWTYAFVRGVLQVGLPLAGILTLFIAGYRWGIDLRFWNWGSFTLSLAVNFTVIPVLGFFLGRAFYYSKK